MNRICIELDKNGEFGGIVADSEIEIYIVSPHTPSDRVYKYGAAKFGPEHVREMIGGFPVGHLMDGTLGLGEGAKLQPSKPSLKGV